MPERDADLVWSSSGGDLRRRRPQQGERSPSPAPAAATGPVRVRRETAGRRGKPVTTVSNVGLDDAGLRELAGALKRACGVGGSAKDGVIELQGDHRTEVVRILRDRGYQTVLAGG